MAGGPCSHPPFALSEPACAAISQVNFLVGYLSWRAEQRRQKGCLSVFFASKVTFLCAPYVGTHPGNLSAQVRTGRDVRITPPALCWWEIDDDHTPPPHSTTLVFRVETPRMY